MNLLEDATMVDLLEQEVIELQVDETGKVWVNVDGKCVCRIGYVKEVVTMRPKIRSRSLRIS